MPASGPEAVLVPIKAFSEAKVRLAAVLNAADRAALARSLAAGVIAAARDAAVSVVCDDPEVAEWAARAGAAVIWTPARGLNAAVADGVSALAAAGVALVTVAHADLPLVTDLTGLGRPDTVVLAPDRRRDGTNVIAIPADSGFSFSYGAGSFGRHRAEAERLGLAIEVMDRADLAWDVDVPDDLGPVSLPPPAH
jgi:2-phospho-L-lactate/phosphoenolpyruvate guanylyltransferase